MDDHALSREVDQPVSVHAGTPRSLKQRSGSDPDRAQRLAQRVPLQVALGAQDHRAAYVGLASDGARGTTATVMTSDGGVGVRP